MEKFSLKKKQYLDTIFLLIIYWNIIIPSPLQEKGEVFNFETKV